MRDALDRRVHPEWRRSPSHQGSYLAADVRHVGQAVAVLQVGPRLQVAVGGVEGHVGVRRLEHAAVGALRLARRLAAQHRVQEAATEGGHGQEVQVEVDGVVQVAQHVDQLLGEGVLHEGVGAVLHGLQPGHGHEVEDAVGQHQHQEDERDDDQHGGDLLLVTRAARGLVKVVGQLALGLVGHLDVDDDEGVAGDDQEAGDDGVDEGVGPVPVVVHEVLQLFLVAAALLLHHGGEEDGVEGEGEQDDGNEHQRGLPLAVDARHLQREPHGDEALQGHGHQDPAGQDGEEVAREQDHLQHQHSAFQARHCSLPTLNTAPGASTFLVIGSAVVITYITDVNCSIPLLQVL